MSHDIITIFSKLMVEVVLAMNIARNCCYINAIWWAICLQHNNVRQELLVLTTATMHHTYVTYMFTHFVSSTLRLRSPPDFVGGDASENEKMISCKCVFLNSFSLQLT